MGACRAASVARRISVARRTPQRLRRLPERPDERTTHALRIDKPTTLPIWSIESSALSYVGAPAGGLP
jgi:hypothetical protein